MSFGFSEPEGERRLDTVTVTGQRSQSYDDIQRLMDEMMQNNYGMDAFGPPISIHGAGGNPFCYGLLCTKEGNEKHNSFHELQQVDITKDPNLPLWNFELKSEFFLDMDQNNNQTGFEQGYSAGDIIPVPSDSLENAMTYFTTWYDLA